MSEIEKLYRLAGIDKKLICPHFCSKNDCFSSCEKYKDIKEYYPPFTAEKQIAILKALVLNNKAMSITQYYPHKQFCINNDMFIGIGEDFGEALAMFVNKLWQDLTESEQEQIREILK